MFQRKQWVTKGSDPTEMVMWKLQIAAVRVELTEFFGDVTCRVYWKAKQVFFSSPAIHAAFNKLPTAIHTRLERNFCESEGDCEPITQ